MSAWQKRVVAAAVAMTIRAESPLSAAEAGQDSLSAARELYAAAAYEDALVVLNRLRGDARHRGENLAIEQYRAFCLLALGRPADAEQAIEAIVISEPSFQPSEQDVSPRIRSAFRDVRRRMLPSIIQQKYASAKTAFDRKEFARAAEGFKHVLKVMKDSDLGAAVNHPPLSDLRTLAAGFLDLSVTAAAPPPPPPAQPEPVPDPPLPASEQLVVSQVARIYRSADRDVVPPGVVRQWLPPFPTQTLMPDGGAIEVIISETGIVESAVMRVPINPTYDRLAIAAARSWQYKPATVNGVPVKFRKVVQISIKR